MQEAAKSEQPMPANSTNAATPNERMDDARHARQVHHGQIDDARDPVVAGVLIEIDAARMPIGAASKSEMRTRKNVPTNGAQMPPAVMSIALGSPE